MTQPALILSLLLVLGCGCNKEIPKNWPRQPSIISHVHKVWLGPDYLEWIDEKGYGCGNVERANGGWVYQAHVINWDDFRHGIDAQTDYNSFEDAVEFVERWCKP